LDKNFRALGSRFGFAARDARDCLWELRYEPKTSLQEHGIKVERLAQVAYSDLYETEANKRTLTLKAFMRSLNDRELHRHLLAARVETVEDAVKQGKAYYQVANFQWHNVGTRQENAEKEGATSNSTQEMKVAATTSMIQKLVRDLWVEVKLHQTRASSRPAMPRKGSAEVSPTACWGCGGEGHLRRSCPHRRRQQLNPKISR